jgi:hypothetical protein
LGGLERVTHQVKLGEDNSIEFQYCSAVANTGSATRVLGDSATIGISHSSKQQHLSSSGAAGISRLQSVPGLALNELTQQYSYEEPFGRRLPPQRFNNAIAAPLVKLPRAAAPHPITEPAAAVLQIAFTAQVLVKAGADEAAPVVVAADPTFAALFGGVVTDGLQGQPPDHTRLRGGLLHDADGGFLVLDCGDAVAEPGVWKTLIRSMRFGEVGVQNLDVATQGACAALRPDPLPLDVKVVLVGPMALYVALFEGDEDFAAVVKVLAEFSAVVDYRPGLPRELAGVLRRLGAREGLRPLSGDGLAAVLEEAARAADPMQNETSRSLDEAREELAEMRARAERARRRAAGGHRVALFVPQGRVWQLCGQHRRGRDQGCERRGHHQRHLRPGPGAVLHVRAGERRVD